MSFATFTNIIVILIGTAVLVQSARMMRSFQVVRNSNLKEMVDALDKATGQARRVLADLKETLRTDGAANARAVAQGANTLEELSVMIGIANAAAERIVDTMDAVNRTQPQPAEAKQAEAAPAKPKRTRRAADRAAQPESV